MTPVVCRVKHDPENGTYGDCVRACVASIMDMDAEAVPHFNHDNCSGVESFRRINDFLAPTHGAFSVAYDGSYSLDDVLQLMQEQNPTVAYMLFGQTEYGSHVVVCHGAAVIHDPAWFRVPITKPTADGVWIVMVIART